MSKDSKTLAVLDEFRATALELPDRVKAALATIDNVDDAAEALNQAEAMALYARRLRMDVERNNAIQHGILLIKAKVGGLLKPDKGGRPRKGEEKTSLPGREVFSNQTRSTYRKIAEKASNIEDYRTEVDNHNGTLPEDHPDVLEMNTVGFLRYTEGDRNLKASQNTGVVDWYTPVQYIAAARNVMGSIEVDPASSEFANDTVQADTFYDIEDDGLKQPWWGNVWMNPPFKASLIKEFVGKLCDEVECGTVKQAVMLTNNSTDTNWWHQAANVCKAICFTHGRVAFYNPENEIASPTNGHTFFYFGENIKAFVTDFSQFGRVMLTGNKK